MRLAQRLKIGIIVILLISFFFFLNLTGFSKKIKNSFYLISAPVQKILWKLGSNISDFFEAISKTNKLKKENEELKLKIQALLAETGSLRELKKENEILRGALEIGLEKEFKLALAEVIGKDISQDFILINVGRKDGISKDSPVITQQKTLVGKISQVYENFSKVMLISHPESFFDIKIAETEIYGIIKGKGNFKLYLDRVSREEEIQKGALLITAAIRGNFPKGLLVGEIKEIKKSDIEPFQQAEISPFFNIKELETVFVIKEWYPLPKDF